MTRRSMHPEIITGLRLVMEGIDHLKAHHNAREFTIDGRLVGDIGEIVAGLDYDVVIDTVSQAHHDGRTSQGRLIQVKATFKDSLTFKSVPDLYLGLKLYRDGTYEEIFNGPGHIIAAKFGSRAGFGKKLISLSNKALRELSAGVPARDRVPMRSQR